MLSCKQRYKCFHFPECSYKSLEASWTNDDLPFPRYSVLSWYFLSLISCSLLCTKASAQGKSTDHPTHYRGVIKRNEQASSKHL